MALIAGLIRPSRGSGREVRRHRAPQPLIKELLRQVVRKEFGVQMQREGEYQRSCLHSADFAEAGQAFVEK